MTEEVVAESQRERDLLRCAHSLWKEGKFCDVQLQVGDKIKSAHKIVLISLTNYFKFLFEMDLAPDQNVVILDSHFVNFSALCEIIRFGYTGKVNISLSTVQDLVTTADYLGVTTVKNACENFMIKHLDDANCSRCHTLASFHHLPCLKKSAENYFIRYFSRIAGKRLFYDTTMPLLLEVLDSNDIVALENGSMLPPHLVEAMVLNSVVSFINYNCLGDEDSVQLMQKVRMNVIPPKTLFSELRRIPYLLNIKEVECLYHEAINFQSTGEGENLSQPEWKHPRVSGYMEIGHRLHQRDPHFLLPIRPFVTFNDIHKIDPRARIRIIELFIGKAVVSVFSVLRGVYIKYSNGVECSYGDGHASKSLTFSHKITLGEKEVITSLQFSKMCDYISSIQFQTNLNRKLGPFGVNDSVTRRTHLTPWRNTSGYLFGLFGSVVTVDESKKIRALSNITFSWAGVARNEPRSIFNEDYNGNSTNDEGEKSDKEKFATKKPPCDEFLYSTEHYEFHHREESKSKVPEERNEKGFSEFKKTISYASVVKQERKDSKLFVA